MIDVAGVSIDKDDQIQAAHEALERPSDFGYWGDLDLFRSWGLTITQCRDSDSATRSNYRCIGRDLREFVESRGCDPKDYLEDVHFSHWAYGWMEHIAVRVLIDDDGDVVPENITGAFRWIASTALYLREQHHVYDDSDHSDLEHEEGLEIVEQSLADIRNDAENAVYDEPEDTRLVPEWITAEDVLRRLHDNGEDTPRENFCLYEETVAAVWELVDEWLLDVRVRTVGMPVRATTATQED